MALRPLLANRHQVNEVRGSSRELPAWLPDRRGSGTSWPLPPKGKWKGRGWERRAEQKKEMVKFALGLILLLLGSIIFAVYRKARYGGPVIDEDGAPHSLKELVERRRSERTAEQSPDTH